MTQRTTQGSAGNGLTYLVQMVLEGRLTGQLIKNGFEPPLGPE